MSNRKFSGPELGERETAASIVVLDCFEFLDGIV